MHTTALRTFALAFALLGTFALPERAEAANVLLVCDATSDTSIATVLTGDGHTVTTITGDFASGNATLAGDLSMYDVVFWSANGAGAGAVHSNASVFSNLTTYVMSGGRVLVTGYDSIASPIDPPLIAFLGGSGSTDGATPGAIAMVDNAMTTGVVDIRGVTPTGGYGDQDTMTGLMADTISISPSGTGAAWTLRTVGSGLIAYVSNGAPGAPDTVSWTTSTGAMGARAYNAVIRNFAFGASGAGGPCTGEDTACTTTSGRTGVCHMDSCCAGCWDATMSRCFGGTTGTACGVAGGACISCADGMPCTSDVCTAGACSNPTAPAGTACDDGMFCNTRETCSAAGVCGGGGPNPCDDASSCTVDTCDEATDMCVHTPGGGCFIAGTCRMSFTVNPANPCQVCDPARSTTDWSPRTTGVACGSATCTVIGGFGTLTGVGMCDGTGTCVTAPPMVCPSGRCTATFPSTACNPSCATGTCPGGLTCSTATMRCVTPAAIGEACMAGSECASGFCADGVCCMTACDQLCDSCDLVGSVGTCAMTPPGRSCGLPICTAGSLTAPGACDAAGMCVRPGATTCPSGLCSDAVTCNPNCSPASCPAGQICTAAMRCVVPAADGEICGANDECMSGACADGVCCNTRCADICESCAQAGREGLCTPYTAGGDPESECPIGSVCGGGRACAVAGLDAGPPSGDGGPIDASIDGSAGFDAGVIFAPPRRGCSCRAVGLSDGSSGALAALAFGLALALRRRVAP